MDGRHHDPCSAFIVFEDEEKNFQASEQVREAQGRSNRAASFEVGEGKRVDG